MLKVLSPAPGSSPSSVARSCAVRDETVDAVVGEFARLPLARD